MRAYILLSLIAIVVPACAQWPVVTAIPVPFADRAPTIASASNGDVVAGSANQVIRMSQDGRIVWTRQTPLEQIAAVGVAPDGSAFVTGSTATASFVLKLDPQGSVTATRQISGQPTGMTVDPSGAAYITGWTGEGFIATPGAWKAELGAQRCSRPRSSGFFACSDAFVIKLRADTTVEWATLLGGTWNDIGRSIAVDREGGVWIAGETMSEDLVTTPTALQRRFGGRVSLGPLEYGDAFLARLDSNGRRLLYSTYLGGTGVDYATAVVVAEGGVVVTGATQSNDFPVSPNAHQAGFSGDPNGMPNASLDAFVAHFSTSGERLYSSYFGTTERREFGSAAASAGNRRVGIALSGRNDSCILRYDFPSPTLREECFQLVLANPLGLAFVNETWIAAGRTKQGHEVPGVDAVPRLVVSPLAGIGDNSGPAVIGLWTEYIPIRRPLVAADSIVSIYHPGVGRAGLANTSVRLGDRSLTLLYAGGDQVNAVVPADMPLGVHPLVVGMPFFSTVPVAVDVVQRWPGLYSGALNQDGTINSESNPAPLGSIVSLFGNGFGPEPLPAIEPYITSNGGGAAQGMEVLYAGLAPGATAGTFQVNARIPGNAQIGRAPVRLVFRVESFLQTPLGYIWVK